MASLCIKNNNKNNNMEDDMKAIVYNGKKNVDVENVEDPKIEKSDDIIIKVTSTAICGSDLHLIHGMIPNMPKGFRLGH